MSAQKLLYATAALTLLSASLACWLVEPGLHVKLPLLLEMLVGNHIVM